MPPERPTFIARYEIQARLGQGAMGIVYKARDPQLDRIVAIKTVRSDLGLASDEFAVYKQRFFQEAKAAGRLNHPNVVAIYDVMEVEQTPYIVMEYVESDTLATLIKTHGALPPDRAVEIARHVCLALEHAHAHGVVHRDIKPANILFGNTGEVKVGDFGIARIEGQDLTLTGACLGTPCYMSPEQIRGRAVDGRSDLFSLGAVLYEALTGERPFPGQDAISVIHGIAHDEPVPLHERNARVHPALSAAVARALAKDREQRYPTARAFADALGAPAAESRADTPAVTPRRSSAAGPVLTRGRRLALIGVCGVVVATAAGLTAWRHLAPARTAEVRVVAPLPPRPPPVRRLVRRPPRRRSREVVRTARCPSRRLPLSRFARRPPHRWRRRLRPRRWGPPRPSHGRPGTNACLGTPGTGKPRPRRRGRRTRRRLPGRPRPRHHRRLLHRSARRPRRLGRRQPTPVPVRPRSRTCPVRPPTPSRDRTTGRAQAGAVGPGADGVRPAAPGTRRPCPVCRRRGARSPGDGKGAISASAKRSDSCSTSPVATAPASPPSSSSSRCRERCRSPAGASTCRASTTLGTAASG